MIIDCLTFSLNSILYTFVFKSKLNTFYISHYLKGETINYQNLLRSYPYKIQKYISQNMKVLYLLTFLMSITTIYAFTGMIFTPKGNYSSNSPPVASIRTQILSKCWVSQLLNDLRNSYELLRKIS